MTPKKYLGQTGIEVSTLGLGTVKFGRNQQVKYPTHFEIPDDRTLIELLAITKQLGINLLDTAPAYGESEERLGKFLKNQRHEWVICTKIGEEFFANASHYDFTVENAKKSIERSLKRLQTDFLDIVLVHSNGDDVKIIEQSGLFSLLEQLKQSGIIRAFGMSTKTVEGGKLALDYSDVAMVTLNPLETTELPVIEYAQQKNKGIFIKKAFASGHLNKIPGENPVHSSLQFIFKHPGVTSVIVGTINKHHLQQAKEALG